MAEPIIMPKFEMSQEIGTIVEWSKKEGDKVEKGEPILVVETDKVTMDVECPASGVLAGLRGKPGESIPVTEIIGYVLQPGEELPISETVSDAPPSVSANQSASPERTIDATPVAQRMAEKTGVDVTTIQGSGPGGRVTKADVESVLAKTAEIEELQSVGDTGKVRATPAARRVARENEIELGSVPGSGPRERVQAADVLRAVASATTGQQQKGMQSIPFTGMRKKIADRMTVSYQTAPHIYMTLKAEMSAFEDFRERLNERAKSQGVAHLSATVLLVKAVSWALLRNPVINSALHGDTIDILPETNIGVAVALDGGLIVPVVKNAEQLCLSDLAENVADLVSRARTGDLVPSDVVNGTFTITNLGAFGIEQFTAIINPGQTGILAVGAIQDEVVPDGEGGIAVLPMMHMTLGLDHRVADGASGARFLADLRDVLQEPDLMLW
jgi:pyruvate dehydrogenase E2 component (dihydrolipoamide acetyltransferase)